MPMLVAIPLAVLAAKLGAGFARRIGQPAVLGSLVAGLLIGPSALHLFGLPYFAGFPVVEFLQELGGLGVILLLFNAGLETHLGEMLSSGKAAVLAGVMGVLLPVGLGALATLPFGYSSNQAIFMGIVMGASSVSISAQTFMELGKLRTREGLTMLGAAVVDDVLALVLLSIYMAVKVQNGVEHGDLGWTMLRMVLVLGVALALGLYLLPWLARWSEKLPISEPVMSVALIVLLFYAWAAEALGGVAAITGAFIAGMGFERSTVNEKVAETTHALAYALLVPIFLVGIGLHVDLRTMSLNDWALASVVSLVAIVSKILGAGLGAYWGGLKRAEALRVGVGMICRGEVGLIIAGIGVGLGILPANAFTITVAVVLVTDLFTPSLLPMLFNRKEAEDATTDHARAGRPRPDRGSARSLDAAGNHRGDDSSQHRPQPSPEAARNSGRPATDPQPGEPDAPA